jgi:hypothetical protein
MKTGKIGKGKKKSAAAAAAAAERRRWFNDRVAAAAAAAEAAAASQPAASDPAGAAAAGWARAMDGAEEMPEFLRRAPAPDDPDDDMLDPIAALDGPEMTITDVLDPHYRQAQAEYDLAQSIVEPIKYAMSDQAGMNRGRIVKKVALTPAKVLEIVTAVAERVAKFVEENPNYGGAADVTPPAGGNGRAKETTS